MIAAFRLIGFVVAAIGLQFASGLGFSALALGVVIGWFRLRIFWLIAPILCFGFAAQQIEAPDMAGKVGDAQSSLAFMLFIYALISLVGFFFGKILQRRL